MPLILKSCAILPLFVTLKMTVVPVGTTVLESLNFHSEAVTLIVTVLAAVECAPIAGIANAAPAPTTPTIKSARRMRTRCNRKPPLK